MIIVLGSAVVQEQHFAHALSWSRQHVLRSRGEPGCIAHAVHRDTENPRRLVFVAQWPDRAALRAHFKLAASRTFAQTLAGLVSQPLSLAPAKPPRTEAEPACKNSPPHQPAP